MIKFIREVVLDALGAEYVVSNPHSSVKNRFDRIVGEFPQQFIDDCLLYTSPSPRDRQRSRMPSSA